MSCHSFAARVEADGFRRRVDLLFKEVSYAVKMTDGIAPFQIALVPMNMQKSERVREAAEALYAQLKNAGYDVLLDDRNERPGVKFADMELMGIPHRIVIGDRGLDNGQLEYRHRRADDNEDVAIDSIMGFVRQRVPLSA